MEPGPGHPPFAFNGGSGNAHYFGGLLNGETSEESELDELSLIRVERLQAVERLIEFVEGDFRDRGETDAVVDRENLCVATALLRTLVAGVVDENAPHQLGGHAEEVGAALPVYPCLIHQLHVGFMHKRGCLQRVVCPFPPHIVCRDPAKFLIHDGEELIVRAWCSKTCIGKELSDFAAGLWAHRS